MSRTSSISSARPAAGGVEGSLEKAYVTLDDPVVWGCQEGRARSRSLVRVVVLLDRLRRAFELEGRLLDAGILHLGLV